jgi:dihydrofolate synthase/folylpolyglutamate synthase
VKAAGHERYEERRAWLYGLSRGGVKLGLDRMEAICAALGHPERAAPSIVVAGTNGKGSVSAMLHAAFLAAGQRAGLYTSPHLHTVRERVRIGARPMTEAAFVRAADELSAAVGRGACPEPTFFEAMTALAWLAMRHAKVDVQILEVGLGGRLDATNVAGDRRATVITSIAMDHEAYLGSTIEAIAGEKAGVLRRDVPAVICVSDPGALRTIKAVAKERRAPAFVVGTQVRASRGTPFEVRVGDHAVKGLAPGLPGEHQRQNAITAAATLLVAADQGLRIPAAAIRAGIHDVRWPGRLETIEGTPPILFDAAHNPAGAETLAAHLASLPRMGRRVLLFGVMADKDWPAMLRTLSPQIDERVYAAPALGRAEKLMHLDAFAPGLSAPSVTEGLAMAKARAGERGLVIVAGSIFVLAEARAAALGIENEPPIAM